MSKSNEELSREIVALREEVRQMKEIVAALFSMMVESEEDEEDVPFFSAGADVPRMNN
ncbi:MAG: hypothetical protein A4E32_00713 [Methanomassiliicoccales archaeon PtaU1.Bin124]|nr:MAG: hypothetical protein A4E32_00713 [Methanomassiliicoccales archaeon PtaU1.Bin124]